VAATDVAGTLSAVSSRPEVVPGADAERDGADPHADDGELRAADGRVPGRRGRATRQRLLEQTAEMLTSTSYRELKVVDIARAAGTSPATFYQYFPDVEAAILVIAEEMALVGAARLSGLVREHPWKGRAAWPTSLGLVEGFMAFWEEHRSLIRVVDLATEEGDPRFRRVRVGLLNELTNALAEVVDGFRKGGRQPADLDPMATAGVLVSMLAHVAAHRYGFEFWGIRSDDLERSMARIVFTTVTGQKPPAGS
jgi:AcrR family transcriptional regulator